MDQIKEFIQSLEKIFAVKVNVKINYVNTREEMNKILGRKTENWVVGSVKEDIIYIFYKKLFPIVSKQHTEEDFYPVLKHEIVHLFIHKAFGKGSAWFDEGLACILAGQKKKLPKENPDPRKLITREDFRIAENPYGKSVKLVMNILNALKDEKNKKSN